MKRQTFPALTLWKDDRGVALPLALMALMVLGALSAALLTIGGSEVQISYNHLRGTQAQFMAEAGLEDAFNWFRSDTSRLPAFNATISDTWTSISTLSGPGTALQDYGSYNTAADPVQYRVLGPNTVLVKSTGTSKIGSGKKVLRAIITNGFASDDAIRTDGSLRNSGSSFAVTGSCGSVHTNSNYTTSGSSTPSFSEGLTATGTAASPGTSFQPQKLIPKINTSDFWDAAKATLPAANLFQMGSDGSVRDKDGALIAGLPNNPLLNNQKYRGWKYQTAAGQIPWGLASSDSPSANNATYYFKTDVDINGSDGTLTATILATGDIKTSGGLALSPHLTATLLVSDKDIDLGGNSGSTASGLIAAKEQIDLSGNVTITGSILAEGAPNTADSLFSPTGAPFGSSDNPVNIRVSGGVTVNYTCDQGPPIKGPVRYLAWGF